MAKRFMLLLMALTVLISFTVPETADARRGGGFKSPRGGFTQTPKKQQDNIKKAEPAKNTNTGARTTTGTTKRGFFSGGSFVKGMMIGGFAGLLFGGMFGNMGFLGNLLGLMVNVFAIYLLIVLVAAIWNRMKRRNHPADDDRRRY